MAIDPVVTASAISAAGSLLGGAGGGTDAARLNRIHTLKLYKQGGERLREGAERSGFNPLTYAQIMGGSTISGGGSSGPAPLASVGAALSTFGNAMLDREIAEEQQERTHKSAMAQLEAIQRSQREAGGVGGVITRTVGGLASRAAGGGTSPDGFAGAAIDAERKIDVADVMNTPGANVIENDWTFGPVYLPGSEPPEADEAVMMAPIILPQISYNVGGKLGRELDKKRWAADMADSIKRRKAWNERRAYGVGFNQSQAQDYTARRDILNGY